MSAPNELEAVEVRRESVSLKLANGVFIDISSNKGYLYINFSGIGYEKPIEIKNVFANGCSIYYPTKPE